jgi:integrase/recombinase XerD
MTDQARQLPLLPSAAPGRAGGRWTVPLTQVPDRPLEAESSLGLALHWFGQEMQRLGMADNTRRTYAKAVGLLVRYLGRSRPLCQIGTDDLQRFQAWVEERAGSPKTAELKLTAVRRFFTALYEAGILPVNVAGDMYPLKAASPLPVVLHPAQADAVRRCVAAMATRADDPDVLPALLVTLLLDVGLRIGEAERLHPDDVDLSNPLRPVVHVRYADKRHRAKRRALACPPALAELVRRHHGGEERLFACSRRQLQYVVARVGAAAGLQRQLTPGTLRWTYALDQFQAGVDPETLRQRLGLSNLGWRDVEVRLRILGRRPL